MTISISFRLIYVFAGGKMALVYHSIYYQFQLWKGPATSN